MNKRTWTALLVIAAIIVVAWGGTALGRARKTGKYLEDMASQDPGKIMDAMSELQARGKAAGPAVVNPLQTGSAEGTQRAAWLLGMLGSHAGDEALVGALQDTDPVVRIAALESIGRLRLTAAAGTLATMLADDKQDVKVRCAAAHALASFGGEASVAPLAKMLALRPAPVPPAPPAPPAPAPVELTPEAKAALMAAVKPLPAAQPGAPIVPAAKPTVPAAPEPPAPPPPDTTIEVRKAAASALGRMSEAKAVAALAEALKDATEPNPEVRVAAAYALGDAVAVAHQENDLRVALEALLSGLKDKVGDVRIASAYALRKATVPASLETQALEGLKAAADDTHYWVRQAAKEAMLALRLGAE